MFDLPLYLILLACLVVMLASAVQTAIGFGVALIAVPLLLLIDTSMVPAPVVMIAFVQLLMSVFQYWHKVDWQILKFAFIGRLPGTFVAMWMMSYFGETGVKLFIGAAVLAVVVISLLKLSAEPNQRNHLWAGFFCGITGTTSGIGGPPLALLYQHQTGDFIRANLSGFFLIGSVISLIGMGMVGFVTVQSWIYAALFLPSTLLGVLLGRKLKVYLKPTFMRPAILSLCSASAVTVILTTI